ncbi:MAG: type III-A CRISPR-associated RAMP protein Csm3, partial [Hydrogenobacter sp.]
NIGNLVCPAEFNIGEDIRVAILSIPEGDDKVEKYPLMFATSEILVLNKYDMKEHFEFNDEKVENIAKENPKELPGPPRLKVFDAYLTKESLEVLQEITQGLLTEVKTENQINRITSRANPRKVERVPAGAIFEGKMVFDMYKEGDEDCLNLVFAGMRALEDSYLGGYGSRGSGRVKFENIRLIYRPKEYYLGIAQEQEIVKVDSLAEVKDQEVIDKLREIAGKSKNAG